MPELTFRRAGPADWASAIALHREVFGRDAEARLVELLHLNGEAVVSLLATDSGRPVAHAVLSPVRIDGVPSSWLVLGPVAVRPDRQCQGVGSELVRAILAVAQAERAGGVVVEGAARFFQRFDFAPAAGLMRAGQGAVAQAPLLALPLAADLPRGVVRFSAAFDEAIG